LHASIEYCSNKISKLHKIAGENIKIAGENIKKRNIQIYKYTKHYAILLVQNFYKKITLQCGSNCSDVKEASEEKVIRWEGFVEQTSF